MPCQLESGDEPSPLFAPVTIATLPSVRDLVGCPVFAHADTLPGPSEIGPPGDGLAAPGHEHRATFLGVGEPGGDHLTAPEGAIARRHPGGRLTLADCFRAFLGHVSPWVIAAALLAALVARVTAGHWSWRDPVIAIALVAAEPFTEWVIHVYVLHSRRSGSAGVGSTSRRPASTASTIRRPPTSTECSSRRP